MSIFLESFQYWAQFAGNALLAEPSPLVAHRARPTSFRFKNEYMVLPLGEETAVQAVVGSYRLGVSQAQKAKVSGDERPRLRAP